MLKVSRNVPSLCRGGGTEGPGGPASPSHQSGPSKGFLRVQLGPMHQPEAVFKLDSEHRGLCGELRDKAETQGGKTGDTGQNKIVPGHVQSCRRTRTHGRKETTVCSSCKFFWLGSGLSHAEPSFGVRMDLASNTGMTQVEELCSPGSPRAPGTGGTVTNCVGWPSQNHGGVWTRALAFLFPSLFFFSSFLFLFSFLRHVAKLKASSVQMPSALHYQSFPNDSSGNHKPQILHNSHGLFLPCKMDTDDFHNQFPSLEMKQHKNEKVRFLSNSLSMSDQGKASGGTRVEQPPN